MPETCEYGSDVIETACMASSIKQRGGCSRRQTYHIRAEHLTEQVSVSVRLRTCYLGYAV